MKIKTALKISGITLLSVAFLAACGNQNSKSSSSTDTSSFADSVTNDGSVINGGQLNYAIVDSAGSTGLFIDELTSSTVDATFGGFVDESMFGTDANRQLDDSGLAKAEFDEASKTVTVSLTGKDYKWSDGQPFTIDDYIFTIEQMGSKDYTGVRYDDGFSSIVGMADYHDGKASTISGIEKVDDYTVKLKYEEFNPSMTYGSWLPSYVTPKHIFQNIPVKDWETSEYARTNKVVGMGPYKIKSIVSGESVVYEANENYYKGKPKISTLKVDVVSPDTIASEMQAGNYDIAEVPADQYEQFTGFNNIDLLGSQSNTLHYLGFKLGKIENGKRVMNPSAKLSDVRLRQAISYALDNKTAGQSLFNGLWTPANSLEISFFGDLHDSELAGYTYDVDKAKQLLDEAGYKDTNNDGYREDPNGKAFTISLAAPQRGDSFEALIQDYIQKWEAVGLKVELYTGKTMERNAFYDEVPKDNTTIDMYLGAFGTGYDPAPLGLWGPSITNMNYTGYVSDKNTELLNKLVSTESMDKDKRIANYKEWQQYAFDEDFATPLFEVYSVTAVNKRVKYFDVIPGSKKASMEKLELVANTGVASK
ncbi:oligopeptide ABC transporter substrate-binding protein [Streptococcus sp. DD13]|uniref:oligopeptide ABC transporter substrate-binding protein n=1 Tax=Streptococcus sp. DD13 TaxID=1777881 RepID=UPI0007984BA2|nr:oligopeptide ABC transporter substrate-binding protein [Streptococcus sp. DD13]KXT78683.1 Oligopeptide ABC transporter, periplasmic oligopeptide-binding protein OppA [Streptococcus sp. DD13]